MLEDLQIVPVTYEARVGPWRNYLCSSTNSDYGGTTRSFHNPVAAFNQVRLLYTNFYTGSATGEANLPGAPGPITVSAVIEEPGSGTAGAPNYPVTFNGQASVTIPLHGMVVSDPIDLDVAANTVLWVRTYVQGLNAQYFPCNASLCANGTYGQTGYQSGAIIPGFNANDNTTVGTNFYQDGGNGSNQLLTAGTAWITTSLYAKGYCPTAILGQFVSTTPRPIIVGIGDSIMQGDQDTNFAEVGFFARALRAAQQIPFIICGGLGEQLYTMYASQTYMRNRKTLSQYASHAIVAYGINDVNGNVSLPSMKTYAQAGYQWLVNRGIKVYASTLLPNTTGSWASSGAQTPGTYDAVRKAWNAYLRSWPNPSDPVLSLLSGVFDPAALIEVNAANQLDLYGGRWYCGPGNNTAYTPDGLHPGPNGNLLLQAAINTALFTAPPRRRVDQFGSL